MRHALSLPAACLLLLTSCTGQNIEPTLEGKWASHSETDYLYPPPTFNQIARKYVPTSVVGKYCIEITPDSFIYFDTKEAQERRINANSYKRVGSVVLVPKSQRTFEIKRLTADTLTLFYKRSRLVSSKYGYVNSTFTFTRQAGHAGN